MKAISSKNLWQRFLELQDIASIGTPKNLTKLIADIRELLRRYYVSLKEITIPIGEPGYIEPRWEAEFRRILGYALRLAGDKEQSLTELRFAMEHNGGNLHLTEEFVAGCLHFGEFAEAARAVNVLTVENLESEHDSTATKILRWALQNPEFAASLDSRVLKDCVELVAKYSADSAELLTARKPYLSSRNAQRAARDPAV